MLLFTNESSTHMRAHMQASLYGPKTPCHNRAENITPVDDLRDATHIQHPNSSFRESDAFLKDATHQSSLVRICYDCHFSEYRGSRTIGRSVVGSSRILPCCSGPNAKLALIAIREGQQNLTSLQKPALPSTFTLVQN
jgi:hypothetical protein